MTWLKVKRSLTWESLRSSYFNDSCLKSQRVINPLWSLVATLLFPVLKHRNTWYWTFTCWERHLNLCRSNWNTSVFQTLVHTSMNWEYPWPPHKIWHQHIKEVQLYTPVHSSNLDHTWKVCSHLYLLPVTLWLISEFGCMVTLFASSARFKGNCWCLLTLDELIWRPYNRKESWPGIILHWTFSPPELTLMRLWVFVVEMKINHLPSEIQPKKTVGSRSLQKNVIFNYYPHHLMTLLLSYLQFLIFVWM